MSRCRSCGAEVEWAVTSKGKRIPLDVGTRDDGNLRVMASLFPGEATTVQYVPPGDGDRVSHFATCPNAEEHRR